MKIVFLDAATMGSTPLTEIEKLGELTTYESSTAEEARERVKDADVALLNKIIVNKEFLDSAPKLKLICEAGTGVATRNVAGYSTDSVAQITWTLILALSGRLFHYNEYARDGRYASGKIHTDSAHPYTELAGKTIGIVGMGAIGNKVAKIAEMFGMKVIYYSTSGTSHCKEYPSVPLEQLMKESDVISVHAPFNPRTAGLVGEKELRLMKPTAFIVNMGRGGIVVEDALAKVIDEGVIGGAGLDVFVTEPLPEDHPLLHTRHPEKLSLTPHTAWASVEARQRLIEAIAANIAQGF